MFDAGKFIPTNETIRYRGQVRNQLSTTCIDTLGNQHPGSVLGMYSCHPSNTPSFNQAFIIDTDGHFRMLWDSCLSIGAQNKVEMVDCAHAPTWEYSPEKQSIVHTQQGLCMAVQLQQLVVEVCSASSPAQRWSFSGVINI